MPSRWDRCPQPEGLPRALRLSSPLGWGLLSLRLCGRELCGVYFPAAFYPGPNFIF